MFQNLTEQQQKLLAVGLLLFVILLLYLLLIMPLMSLADENEDVIAGLEFRLKRHLRTVDSKDEVLAQVDEIRRRLADSEHFSTRETTALASADLQQFIKNTVIESGGQLTSTQVMPAREDGRFIRIGINIRMNGNMDSLRNVLYEIETARPLLMVESLTIRPIRGRRNRRTRQMEASDKLNVNLEVVGYMRTGASTSRDDIS